MKRISKFALLGAMGFSIGAVIVAMIPQINRFFIPGAAGAVGITTLGLALHIGWRRTLLLALLGGIAFYFGNALGTMLVMSTTLGSNFAEMILRYSIWSGSIAVIAGTALGLVLINWRSILRLILAVFIGYSIGMIILGYWFNIVDLVPFIVLQIIGGASVGAVFGFMKNDKNLGKQNISQ